MESAGSWRPTSCTHDFLPSLQRLSPYEPIGDRLHQMTTETKEILCESL